MRAELRRGDAILACTELGVGWQGNPVSVLDWFIERQPFTVGLAIHIDPTFLTALGAWMIKHGVRGGMGDFKGVPVRLIGAPYRMPIWLSVTGIIP